RRQVVIDAHVVRLADVDAGVVGAGRDVETDPSRAAVRGEEVVLAVVVGAGARDAPVVDAEEEDALAGETVDGDSAHVLVLEPLRLVGEARRPVRAWLREHDALILTAGVLELHGAEAVLSHDRDAALLDDDGTGARRVERAGASRFVIG